jgi:hypothetical protein
MSWSGVCSADPVLHGGLWGVFFSLRCSWTSNSIRLLTRFVAERYSSFNFLLGAFARVAFAASAYSTYSAYHRSDVSYTPVCMPVTGIAWAVRDGYLITCAYS